MAYSKQTWQNNPPSTATPISAARLSHLETQYDEAIAQVAADIADPDSDIGTELSATYADLPTVQAVDERTAPQKMLFGLPVHKPHRSPTMAIQRTVPTPQARFQVVFTEGDTLWAYGRDNSLYRFTPSTRLWEQRSHHSSGVSLRGGMVRCQDGSLLLYDVSSRMRRSTNDGATWTQVMERRTAGLEPLTSQSTVVDPITGYVYYGEYTNGVGTSWPDVILWRSTDHGATWAAHHTFQRPGTGAADAIVHIHSLQWDPIGQQMYLMAGDSTDKTGLWRVTETGCVPVLTNDMLPPEFLDAPRAIGMMFFPDYIAWGSDSTNQPYLFRIPRSAFGTDPSQLERGPRLSSTAWGTSRASADGSRWALFTSDEAFPNFAADKMAHIYAVEDQGATIYEVGAVPAKAASGVTTLQPLAPPHLYGDDFWFAMRSGAGADYGAWQARLGYGSPAVQWPQEVPATLIQSQSSGRQVIPGSTAVEFGVSRVPAFGRTLAIYESSLIQYAGQAGNLSLQLTVDGVAVYSSAAVSRRQQARVEHGGPITTLYLDANKDVVFQLTNTHSTEAQGAATVTFAWVN